jgi:hypothetical protein
MHNAKMKKDNGKEFMKTKVKYFGRFLSRMKRPALPKRTKGADGEPPVSNFEQRSDAIKALTNADEKALVAFVETQEKARKDAEQSTSAVLVNNTFDEDGILVMKQESA